MEAADRGDDRADRGGRTPLTLRGLQTETLRRLRQLGLYRDGDLQWLEAAGAIVRAECTMILEAWGISLEGDVVLQPVSGHVVDTLLEPVSELDALLFLQLRKSEGLA